MYAHPLPRLVVQSSTEVIVNRGLPRAPDVKLSTSKTPSIASWLTPELRRRYNTPSKLGVV
jgi:hypothetical protein